MIVRLLAAVARGIARGGGLLVSNIIRMAAFVWHLGKAKPLVSIPSLLALLAAGYTLMTPALRAYEHWRFPLVEYKKEIQEAAAGRDWMTVRAKLDAIENVEHMEGVYLLYSGYFAIHNHNPQDPERYLNAIPPTDPHFLRGQRMLFIHYVKTFFDAAGGNSRFHREVLGIVNRIERSGVKSPMVSYFRLVALDKEYCASALDLLSDLEAEYSHMLNFDTYQFTIREPGGINLDASARVLMVVLSLQYGVARHCEFEDRSAVSKSARAEVRRILRDWDHAVLHGGFNSVGQLDHLNTIRRWAGMPEPIEEERRCGILPFEVLPLDEEKGD